MDISWRKLIPARSTMAGGLAALATWGIGLALTAGGVVLPPLAVAGIGLLTQSQEIGLAVAVAGTLANHFMPDSLKDKARQLNTDVVKLATVMPQLYYQQSDFPDHVRGPQTPVTSNFTVGQKPSV